ncbi:centromere protein H (CENP-H)-domain-containing protein [Podospora aff. communis PSN243]|uniref:Centromere protein H (CENP-H)-domain-containing protein n=1 Tax=Podospora aff. communis PSN243 TaxID=3040156 RepID=A0AAV9GPD9_9PEZI|nr:centromere protein H (CENP-H)-domain-containing protein [Podospora aff. communis PSN243]
MSSSTPIFSPPEMRALELYDRLRELQLQLALLRARQEHVPGSSLEGGSSQRGDLQPQLLAAKAAFSLRNAVIDNVVIVEPTLRAVHNATHASPVERDLLPHIQRRELANIEEAKHHRAVQEVTKSLDELELEGCRASHRNGALAAELLQLAENNRSPVTEASYGGKFAGEITTLEQEIKMSRKKWKLMKGAASGIVGGSGIDWVRDERLRGIVLDSAEE